jgi:hypothetical protein
MNFFTFPLFFRTFGLVAGALALVFSNVLNWWACGLILRASEFTGKNSFSTIIEAMFGPRIKRLISVSFFLDYFSNYVFLLIQSWVCFQFVLSYFGLLDASTQLPGYNLEFAQYHPDIFAWRLVFIAVVFLVYTPVFMHDSYDTVRCITIYCSIFWVCFVAFLTWDFQQFRRYYTQTGKLEISLWVAPNSDQLRLFFILVSSLYIQTSLMTMKGEIANPNLRRMLKSSRIAYTYILVFAMILGVYFYSCLGNHFTSDVFMVRKSFHGKLNEGKYVVLVAILAILNLAYIKFYHGNMKGFIVVRFKPKPSSEVLYIIPWIASLLFVLVYPKVLNFYAYSAATVFLLNGYLLPIMMKRKIDQAEKRHWIHIRFCDLLLGGLAILACASLWITLMSE